MFQAAARGPNYESESPASFGERLPPIRPRTYMDSFYHWMLQMTDTLAFCSLALCTMLSLGCNSTNTQQGASSSVAATETTRRMVGQWGIDGEVALIIELDRDRVVVSSPDNDTWRMDILDAKIVNETIHFTQKNYLHDGESHPFNGVACNSVAKLADDDTLELGMSTVQMPEIVSDLLTRIE